MLVYFLKLSCEFDLDTVRHRHVWIQSGHSSTRTSRWKGKPVGAVAGKKTPTFPYLNKEPLAGQLHGRRAMQEVFVRSAR